MVCASQTTSQHEICGTWNDFIFRFSTLAAVNPSSMLNNAIFILFKGAHKVVRTHITSLVLLVSLQNYFLIRCWKKPLSRRNNFTYVLFLTGVRLCTVFRAKSYFLHGKHNHTFFFFFFLWACRCLNPPCRLFLNNLHRSHSESLIA